MMGPIFGGLSRLRFNSNVNIVVDGNSLANGAGGSQNITRVLAKSYPVASSTHMNTEGTTLDGQFITQSRWIQSDLGIKIKNCAWNGDTWRKMMGLDGGGSGPTEVDNAWVAGATNVLILWEGTNSISVGRTPAQAISDAKDYMTGRLAVHPWIILVGTCLPRQSNVSQAATNQLNADLETYNSLLRSSYKDMGAKGVFDVRQAGSPFNFPNYDNATFEAAFADPAALWTTGETGQHIHLSDNGYIYVTQNCITPALQKLPAR